MAYLDLHSIAGGGGASNCTNEAVCTAAFSLLETHAIALGRHDHVSTLRRRRVMRRVVDGALGIRSPNALADPRLEALRRYVVASVAQLPLDTFRSELVAVGYGSRQKQFLEIMINAGT